MASVHKVSTITDVRELKLNMDTLGALYMHPVDVKALIEIVRNDTAWQTYLPEHNNIKEASQLLTLRGVGERRAWDITEKVEAAGFIFQDDMRSMSVRRLYAAINGNPGLILRYYEALDHISNRNFMTLNRILSSRLSEKAVKIIKLHYGLNDGYYRTFETCSKELGLPKENVIGSCWTSLVRLHNPECFNIIEAIACNRHVPRLGKYPGKMRLYLSTLLQTEEKRPVELKHIECSPLELELEDLGLSSYICGVLRRAGIKNCRKLITTPSSELNKIRSLGRSRIEEIFTACHTIYV